MPAAPQAQTAAAEVKASNLQALLTDVEEKYQAALVQGSEAGEVSGPGGPRC